MARSAPELGEEAGVDGKEKSHGEPEGEGEDKIPCDYSSIRAMGGGSPRVFIHCRSSVPMWMPCPCVIEEFAGILAFGDR